MGRGERATVKLQPPTATWNALLQRAYGELETGNVGTLETGRLPFLRYLYENAPSRTSHSHLRMSSKPFVMGLSSMVCQPLIKP